MSDTRYGTFETTREMTEVEAAAFYAESGVFTEQIAKLPAKSRKPGNAKFDQLGAQLRACFVKHGVRIVANDLRKVL